MKKRKILTLIVCMILLAAFLIPMTGPKANAAGPTLTTTLCNGITVRNDRLTFDVWARNGAGKKIASTVILNGGRVEPTWDDSDKTSYTLAFSKSGENTVVVSASSDGGKKKQLTYHITYQPAAKGEVIGHAVWSVEVFTLGCGYLVHPVSFPIRAGESAAAALVRLLHENGFVGYYSGSVEQGFYLAYIADGTASAESFNGYKKSGTATNPKKLGLSPSIPGYLQSPLKSDMDFYDPADYQKNQTGYLGEFVISNGSGWMYCVNNNFPNVGFSDLYLSDGDVVRVQFTLGYGADIGGMSALGGQIPGVENQPQSGYYAVADKDALTRTMAKSLSSGLMTRNNVKSAYSAALSAAATLNASQSTVDRAVQTLENALQNPDSLPEPTEPSEPTDPSESTDPSKPTDPSESTALTVPSNPSAPSNETTDAAASGNPKENDASDNSSDETNAPGMESAPNGSDTAEKSEQSKQDADFAGKPHPASIIGIVLAVLAAGFAVLFGVRLYRRKMASRNTENKV